MQEFLDVLGQPVESARFQRLIAKYGLREPPTPKDFPYVPGPGDHLQSLQNGVGVRYLNGLVDTVFLYPRYSGPLIGGLTFKSNRDDVIRLLGPPSNSGTDGMTERNEPYCGWTVYDFSEHSIHFSYAAASFAIHMVTLMTPDAAPGRSKRDHPRV